MRVDKPGTKYHKIKCLKLQLRNWDKMYGKFNGYCTTFKMSDYKLERWTKGRVRVGKQNMEAMIADLRDPLTPLDLWWMEEGYRWVIWNWMDMGHWKGNWYYLGMPKNAWPLFNLYGPALFHHATWRPWLLTSVTHWPHLTFGEWRRGTDGLFEIEWIWGTERAIGTT